jgi:hypothetical protein
MSSSKKLLQAAAGAAGGAGGLNIEEVFSTYLYTGNGSTQTITNGIDLAGEGGLVWHKARGQAFDHYLVDTERGGTKAIRSNLTSSEVVYNSNPFIQSFNANGFTQGQGNAGTNGSGYEYASWTFRKAPKFFDVVTYSGSVGSQSIAHNLGSTPGLIITKKLDSTSNWAVYHRSLGATKYILLNSTNEALTGSTFWNDTEPTSTHFTVGTNDATNNSVRDYVAYLFAHNDGDGEFGSTSDQDIIKCGSYTGNGSSTGPSINLGFEPQWLLIKGTSAAADSWAIFDVMRGMTVGASDSYLFPNSSGAELSYSSIVKPTPTGFQLESVNWNSNGNNYIYIAIRRGPMAVPESATDVFAVETRDGTAPAYDSGFPVDMAIRVNGKNALHNTNISARLTQKRLLLTDSTAAEQDGNEYMFDYMDGWNSNASADTNSIAWMWKRAPNYFDVVAYHGNSTSGRTVSHNLGVAPEMIWVKNRDSPVDWWCYHKDLGNTKYVKLNETDAATTDSTAWNNTTPTDTVITLGNSGRVNYSNDDYIAYLFASLDGVSKVGSYTGNGSSNGDSQNIDCGFSSGARFVLIKRTDLSSSWLVFDSTRGIVAGNDPLLVLNLTNAEYTTTDEIDPYSSGFAVTYDATGFATNVSGASYIFYAIA